MIVAIQKGLEGIKTRLAGKGYRVVYYDEYPHPIDAYIYISRSYGVAGLENSSANPASICNLSSDYTGYSTGMVAGNGILYINAASKSVHEIERQLSLRAMYR